MQSYPLFQRRFHWYPGRQNQLCPIQAESENRWNGFSGALHGLADKIAEKDLNPETIIHRCRMPELLQPEYLEHKSNQQ